MSSLQSNVDIIGILFTVRGTSIGPRFCFRYPPVVRDRLSAETRRALENKDQIGAETLQVFAPGYDHTITNTKYSGFNSPSVLLTTLLCQDSIRGEDMEIILDDVRFICFPASLKYPVKETTDDASPQESNTIEGTDLTMFNVVIAVSPEMVEGKTKMCAQIARAISAALECEQRRCNYVSQEVSKMLSVRQQWLEEQKNEDTTKRPAHRQLYDDILNASQLARTLHDIYYGLKDQGIVDIKINSWVSVFMTLKDTEAHPNMPLRPYQALLLLEDSKRLLKKLPKGASPALRQVIAMAIPNKSFQQMKEETEHPLSVIYRVAAHLVYWGKAKIVDVLTMSNVFVLNPNPEGEEKGQYFPFLAQKFATVFPAFRLSEILHRFSYPVQLSQHVQHLAAPLQRRFVEVLVWLMKRGLVMQVYTFIYLNIPPPDDYNPEDEKIQESEHPLAPHPLRSYEQAYIDSIKDNSVKYNNLTRLLPYCRGHHHLVEIMWRANLKRTAIVAVLRHYSDILVCCQHE